MTLADLIAKYAGTVHRCSALELKRNPKFMEACRECEEFREWVLAKKPIMATVRLPVAKFKPCTQIQPEPAKVQPAKAEAVAERSQSGRKPVAEIPKAVQLYRDVVAYAEKSNNLF